jgi:hypothetical protein
MLFRMPNEMELIKLITRRDLLVAISNYSLKAYIYNGENELTNEFSLTSGVFITDFKKKLDKLKDENIQRSRRLNGSKKYVASFIVPFKAFVDKNDYLTIVYRATDGRTILSKYRLNGALYKEYVLAGIPEIGFITSNEIGDIIISCQNNTKIEIYRLKNNEKGG